MKAANAATRANAGVSAGGFSLRASSGAATHAKSPPSESPMRCAKTIGIAVRQVTAVLRSRANPMDESRLRELLDGLSRGAVGIEEAVSRLKDLPFADLGYASVDHHRALRHGA